MDKSLKLQKDIKDNSLELQDFISDLHKWEQDMKDMESQRSPSQDVREQDLPPVRCKKPDKLPGKIITDNRRKKESEEISERKKSELYKKKERISSYDYAAWDKFDVNKALESSSSEDDDESPAVSVVNTKSENDKQNTKTSTVNSQKERAAKLKEEGNKCYSNNRLEDAISKYTQGIALDPTNAILPANRAMAYLKIEKFEAAEADCSRSLKHDPNYIKAYLRRGSARLKLNKLKLAAEDFRKVLELEPWNKDAKKELEKLGKERVEGEIKDQKNDKTCGRDTLGKVKITTDKDSPKENHKEKSTSKETSVTSFVHKHNEKNKVSGKKIKIVEVDSSKCQSESIPSKALGEVINPIVKLPHQRSQKPLKRIKVVEVPSEESIPSELPSDSGPQESKSKRLVDTKVKDASVPVKSANQNTSSVQKQPEPAMSLSVPPVPRTSHQFSQDWLRLAQYQSYAVQYLKAIQPSFFRGLELESEILVDVVSALRWDDFTSEEAILYLDGLAKTDGFGVNILFLNPEQRKVFHDVTEKCKDEKSHSKLLSTLNASLLDV